MRVVQAPLRKLLLTSRKSNLTPSSVLGDFLTGWISQAEGGESQYRNTEWDCLAGGLTNYLYWRLPNHRSLRVRTEELYRMIMDALGKNDRFPFSYTNHINRAHARKMLTCKRRLKLAHQILDELPYWS